MASPISTSMGLGSGLDIGSIVTALVGADTSAKQTQINTQTSLTTAKLSGLGTLKSALASFQTTLTTLGSTTTPAFNGFSSTSSNANAVTATSDNTAVTGNYSIHVNNLATGSKIASAPFVGGASSTVAAGTLQISQGTTQHDVVIPPSATLQTVRDTINTQLQGKGITANIVTDSSGSRLVLGSTTTGSGTDMTTSGIPSLAIDGKSQVVDSTSGAGYIGNKAQDASFTVDGLSMTSKTNTVSGAISGLSLGLVATGDSTVTVATNGDGLQKNLQSFVDSYNSLVKTIGSLTTATKDSSGKWVAAPMTGDSMPRSLLASIRNQLVTTSGSGALTVIAQLGITTQTDGTLSLDSTKFSKALTDKSLGSEVQNLFAGTNGLMARMTAVVTPYTQTGGTLDARSASLNKTQNDLSNQQLALTLQVTNLTASYTAKYNAMDVLVGQLKATSSSISSFFTSLTAPKS